MLWLLPWGGGGRGAMLGEHWTWVPRVQRGGTVYGKNLCGAWRVAGGRALGGRVGVTPRA